MEGTEGEKKEMVLIFHRDNKGNDIARLPNGKIVLHHRKDTCPVVEGIEYKCLVEEKEHWCFAWIEGPVYYPRIIVKSDRSCIGMEKSKTRRLYPDVYAAISDLKNRTNQSYILLIVNEEVQNGS